MRAALEVLWLVCVALALAWAAWQDDTGAVRDLAELLEQMGVA